jgi:hypothetical protein
MIFINKEYIMKKIITLTEKDLSRLVKQIIHKSRSSKHFLNEEAKEYINIPKSGCETYKKGCDPFKYLKVEDGTNTKYYFKKDQDKNWVEAKDNSGIASIKTNVTFMTTPQTQSKLNSQPLNQNNSNVVGSKMKLDNDKIMNGTYTIEELKTIVNGWKPTYDFNLQGTTENDKKIYDWDINVNKRKDPIYLWRNNLNSKIRSNPKLDKNMKIKTEQNLLFLTNLVVDKLENDYNKRWEGVS